MANRAVYRAITHKAMKTVDGNDNMLVPWILMAAYAYSCLNITLIPDSVYDQWCRRAKVRWRYIYHRHKHLIEYTPEQRTVRVMLTSDSFPSIVKDAVKGVIRDEHTKLSLGHQGLPRKVRA